MSSLIYPTPYRTPILTVVPGAVPQSSPPVWVSAWGVVCTRSRSEHRPPRMHPRRPLELKWQRIRTGSKISVPCGIRFQEYYMWNVIPDPTNGIPIALFQNPKSMISLLHPIPHSTHLQNKWLWHFKSVNFSECKGALGSLYFAEKRLKSYWRNEAHGQMLFGWNGDVQGSKSHTHIFGSI